MLNFKNFVIKIKFMTLKVWILLQGKDLIGKLPPKIYNSYIHFHS